MALPPSTANWHWKNKNITQWGTSWIKRELTTITVKGDKGEEVSISDVVDVDGDIELGQRKSKLITIFDTKVTLSWSGIASDGTEVAGSLTIPEVSHEIICDKLSDFVYNWSLSTKPSAEVDAVYALAKARLPAAIEATLSTFPATIIDTHGKDLTVSAQPSRTGTPTPAAASQPVASVARAALSQAIRNDTVKKVNTTTVEVSSTFQASADDLYSLLTDEKKIPMWSRALAVSSAQPDTEYVLFGGGVKGKYISLTPSEKIVQSWALQSPTWPAGHSATHTITLDQSSDSTTVTFSLAGVPLGMEDELKRNLEGYYIHGFKSIGYVQIPPPDPSYASRMEGIRRRPPSERSDKRPGASESTSYLPAVIIAALVLAAAFSIPYLSSAPASK